MVLVNDAYENVREEIGDLPGWAGYQERREDDEDPLEIFEDFAESLQAVLELLDISSSDYEISKQDGMVKLSFDPLGSSYGRPEVKGGEVETAVISFGYDEHISQGYEAEDDGNGGPKPQLVSWYLTDGEDVEVDDVFSIDDWRAVLDIYLNMSLFELDNNYTKPKSKPPGRGRRQSF